MAHVTFRRDPDDEPLCVDVVGSDTAVDRFTDAVSAATRTTYGVLDVMEVA